MEYSWRVDWFIYQILWHPASSSSPTSPHREETWLWSKKGYWLLKDHSLVPLIVWKHYDFEIACMSSLIAPAPFQLGLKIWIVQCQGVELNGTVTYVIILCSSEIIDERKLQVRRKCIDLIISRLFCINTQDYVLGRNQCIPFFPLCLKFYLLYF